MREDGDADVSSDPFTLSMVPPGHFLYEITQFLE